jgi:hypothetical protein
MAVADILSKPAPKSSLKMAGKISDCLTQRTSRTLCDLYGQKFSLALFKSFNRKEREERPPRSRGKSLGRLDALAVVSILTVES